MSAIPANLPSTPARAGAHEPLPPPLESGSAAHRSAKWALFVGGFAVFAMFYGPQPLLSLFGAAFDLSPAQASGVLSATAGAMALGLVPAGFLAQRFGPKPVMLSAIATLAFGTICPGVLSSRVVDAAKMQRGSDTSIVQAPVLPQPQVVSMIRP